MQDIGTQRVHVGVLGNATLADIARHHEYGAPRAGIPERSFLRSTMRDDAQPIERMMAQLTQARLAGRIDTRQMLDLLGLFAANRVKAKIRTNIPPPLALSTIARKGSTLALVDQGRLINSIRWEIVG